MSELEDVLKSDYYKSPLGYNTLDWFLVEVIKIENKITFYYKNSNKEIIITEEKEGDFSNSNICRFSEKTLNMIKLEIIVT